MTTLIVSQILCGLFFLDEISYYSSGGILGIFGGSIVCTIGIMILMKKNSYLANEDVEADTAVYDSPLKDEKACLSRCESERRMLLQFLTENEMDIESNWVTDINKTWT